MVGKLGQKGILRGLGSRLELGIQTLCPKDNLSPLWHPANCIIAIIARHLSCYCHQRDSDRDFSYTDSSNAEEEFARPRVSDADEGGRCRRIRKLKV